MQVGEVGNGRGVTVVGAVGEVGEGERRRGGGGGRGGRHGRGGEGEEAEEGGVSGEGGGHHSARIAEVKTYQHAPYTILGGCRSDDDVCWG